MVICTMSVITLIHYACGGRLARPNTPVSQRQVTIHGMDGTYLRVVSLEEIGSIWEQPAAECPHQTAGSKRGRKGPAKPEIYLNTSPF